jgi:hypothetical protein
MRQWFDLDDIGMELLTGADMAGYATYYVRSNLDETTPIPRHGGGAYAYPYQAGSHSL